MVSVGKSKVSSATAAAAASVLPDSSCFYPQRNFFKLSEEQQQPRKAQQLLQNEKLQIAISKQSINNLACLDAKEHLLTPHKEFKQANKQVSVKLPQWVDKIKIKE